MDIERAAAFEKIITWLRDERKYQAKKFDYGHEPPERLREELSQGSWFWDTGVLNYTGRVRLFGLATGQGRQALMKVMGTLVHLAELAIVEYGDLPKGGYTSGEIVKAEVSEPPLNEKSAEPS